MNFVGRIDAVFTIKGRGVVIVTDRRADLLVAHRFLPGSLLELKDSEGKSKQVRLSSAELALRDTEDYLLFVLQGKVDENELKAFDEVWCETNVEQ